jgi:hypothetical protein
LPKTRCIEAAAQADNASMASTQPIPSADEDDPHSASDAPAPPLGIPLPALAAAIPDLAIGFVFLFAWIAPRTLQLSLVSGLVGVMVMEFIIMHSSAFMGLTMFKSGHRRARALSLLGLGAFYSLFVGGFALAFHTVWPLVSFWGLTLNRLLSVLLGQAPSGQEQLFIRKGWAASALFYLGFAGLTIVPPVPRLGLTPDVVQALHLPGSGLWISEPWRVLAFGFLYFTATGISELYGHRWIRDRDIPKSD